MTLLLSALKGKRDIDFQRLSFYTNGKEDFCKNWNKSRYLIYYNVDYNEYIKFHEKSDLECTIINAYQELSYNLYF